jgi:SAM-dependent methyltransferase
VDQSLSVSLQKHFDTISEAYYDIVDRLWYDVGYYHQREAEIVRERVTSRVNVALDAGCGPGRHTSFLASRADRVIAVDISRRMLAMAHRGIPNNEKHRVDLVQADVRRLPFKRGMIDLIVNLEVLEHLPDSQEGVAATFSEFRRALKPGGLLLTEAPLSRHAWWRLLRIRSPSWKEIPEEMRKEFYEKTPLLVEHAYKDGEIEALLERNGFSPLRTDFVRVLPAGLVERHPDLGRIDRVLERVPLVRRLAREALWTTGLEEPSREWGDGGPT